MGVRTHSEETYKTKKGKMEINLKELLAEVEKVARSAGAFLRHERKGFSLDRVEQKHEHDYVSDVDKNSERMIVAALRKLLPEAGFVTEEGQATFSGEEYYWVIDPLDGTTNFIHGYSPYAVSIALCRGKEIELGVVYDVPADELFSACRGGGAHLNGEVLNVSTTPLTQALLCLELPYNADRYTPFILSMLQHLYGKVGGVRMSGSAAISICHVAAGRLEGWMEKFIGRYDYMAAAIIVQEAGGRVTDFDGNLDFTSGNHIVATNALIHDDLMQVLHTYRHLLK